MGPFVPVLALGVVSLAGCALPAPEPTASDGVPVLVVGGTVVESGPEPGPQGVCDVAAPPFSADDDRHRIWYAPTQGHDADPRAADLVVVRVDRTERLWDDGCWTYRLEDAEDALVWRHEAVPQTLPVRLAASGVEVGGVLLRPGDETEWTVDASCRCSPYGEEATYHYHGTLKVRYMGQWDVVVARHDDLPPLDVPYWSGWD